MEIVIARRVRSGARRNIYLPALLDERMKKFTDVNWSEVASQAFEQVVKELEKQEEAS